MLKNLPDNAGHAGLIPASGDPLEKEMATLFQYSCLGNPTDREAWWATVLGVAKESDTTQKLNNSNVTLSMEFEDGHISKMWLRKGL